MGNAGSHDHGVGDEKVLREEEHTGPKAQNEVEQEDATSSKEEKIKVPIFDESNEDQGLADFGIKFSYLKQNNCRLIFNESEAAIAQRQRILEKPRRDGNEDDDYYSYLERVLMEKQFVLDVCVLKEFYKGQLKKEIEDCFPSLDDLEDLSLSKLVLKTQNQQNTLKRATTCWYQNDREHADTIKKFSTIFETLPNASAKEAFPKYINLLKFYYVNPTSTSFTSPGNHYQSYNHTTSNSNQIPSTDTNHPTQFPNISSNISNDQSSVENLTKTNSTGYNNRGLNSHSTRNINSTENENHESKKVYDLDISEHITIQCNQEMDKYRHCMEKYNSDESKFDIDCYVAMRRANMCKRSVACSNQVASCLAERISSQSAGHRTVDANSNIFDNPYITASDLSKCLTHSSQVMECAKKQLIS